MYQDEHTSSRYLSGDSDPADFSWDEFLSNDNLLTLLCRNGKVKKACSWVSREAIRPRFVLEDDSAILGTKIGQPYTFKTKLDYLEWIGFFTELEAAFTWSRLFGESIMVMFKEGEQYDNKQFLPLTQYDTVKAYHPLANSNGYQIVQDGLKDFYYKVQFTNELGSTTTYNIDKRRVIRFDAPHLELKYKGNSEIEALAKIAIVQEQMLRSVMQRLHYMGAGVAIMQVNGEDEKKALNTAISKSLKYISKVFTSGDPKQVMEMFVPDLNASQFREIWDIAQEEIATDMNMSKKLISGDSQGYQSSAMWDTNISYTEVYQVQRHYKKAIEYVLHYLGFQNTNFEWNDPKPKEDINNSDENDRTTENRHSEQ